MLGWGLLFGRVCWLLQKTDRTTLVLGLLVEGLLLAGGLCLYLQVKAGATKANQYALWALVAFLVLVYIATVFEPPPTDMTSVAWAGQLQWILVLLAYWADRKRQLPL